MEVHTDDGKQIVELDEPVRVKTVSEVKLNGQVLQNISQSEKFKLWAAVVLKQEQQRLESKKHD